MSKTASKLFVFFLLFFSFVKSLLCSSFLLSFLCQPPQNTLFAFTTLFFFQTPFEYSRPYFNFSPYINNTNSSKGKKGKLKLTQINPPFPPTYLFNKHLFFSSFFFHPLFFPTRTNLKIEKKFSQKKKEKKKKQSQRGK